MVSEVAAGAAGGPRLLPTSSIQRFAGCLNSSRQWPINPSPRHRQGLEIALGCVGEWDDMCGILADKRRVDMKKRPATKNLELSWKG